MDSHKRVDLATRIFAEHGAAIRAMIRQHVTCPEDEDEVYQNLYLSLVCHPPPETVTNMPAYLNTVIRHDMIDARRQRRNRQEIVSQYAMSQVRGEMNPPPEERLTQTEEVQRITGLVACLLPAREATAVIERYVHGHSLTDVATHMQVKPRTAARYICVGLKRVREALFRRGP